MTRSRTPNFRALSHVSIAEELEHAMARSQRQPWPVILTLIAIVLLVILWCGYWIIASRLVRDTFESERLKLAAQGVALDCKALHWGGFPFRFERDCIEPTLKLAC